jgi:hypothetical protein
MICLDACAYFELSLSSELALTASLTACQDGRGVPTCTALASGSLPTGKSRFLCHTDSFFLASIVMLLS